MSLLKIGYGLRLSGIRSYKRQPIVQWFLWLNIGQVCPDHSTLFRFRTIMTKAKACQDLFKELNRQLEAHHILVKTGAMVDASVIETPFKGKVNYRWAQD